MSEDRIFGMDWHRLKPHPVFGEWLPFLATVVGLASSLVALAVALLQYEKAKNSKS